MTWKDSMSRGTKYIGGKGYKANGIEYRIKRVKRWGFIVQHKLWWWPFWISTSSLMFPSVGYAQDEIWRNEFRRA